MSRIFQHYGGSHTNGPAKSFVSLFYSAVILGDILLLVLVKFLFYYTITPPVDEAALTKVDSAYEDVEILDQAEEGYAKVLLVRTQRGEELLLPLERLPGFQRYRLVKGSITAPTLGENRLKYYFGEQSLITEDGLTLTGSSGSFLQKDALIVVGMIFVEFLIAYVFYSRKDAKVSGNEINPRN